MSRDASLKLLFLLFFFVSLPTIHGCGDGESKVEYTDNRQCIVFFNVTPSEMAEIDDEATDGGLDVVVVGGNLEACENDFSISVEELSELLRVKGIGS